MKKNSMSDKEFTERAKARIAEHVQDIARRRQDELLRVFGLPGPYSVSEKKFRAEISDLARQWNVSKETAQAVLQDSRHKLANEILKAAGSSVTTADFNWQTELWAIARKDLGLNDEQISRLTPDAFLRLVKRHFQPKKDNNSLVADKAEQPVSKGRPAVKIKRGEICVRVKAEMRRVLYMTREGGRSITEIRSEFPNLYIWRMAESENLTQEDREILLHPNRWEKGYPVLLLSKYFRVSKVTIRDYVTAYNSIKK